MLNSSVSNMVHNYNSYKIGVSTDYMIPANLQRRRPSASGRLRSAIWEMDIGNSSGRSCARVYLFLRAPQYQHVKKTRPSRLSPNIVQNRTEKVEIELVNVSEICVGNSESLTVSFCRVAMWVLIKLRWSSMCLACAMVSEGRVNGSNAHVQSRGSGFSLRLSSDLRVWLNSLSVQPGLGEV